ncbi:MAG: dienelactone hydrolase family protein, partial [Pseudomonadota bacterium]
MCDEFTNQDEAAFLRANPITRRDFNKLGMVAAATILLPTVANAMDVTESEVMVETPDGMADA